MCFWNGKKAGFCWGFFSNCLTTKKGLNWSQFATFFFFLSLPPQESSTNVPILKCLLLSLSDTAYVRVFISDVNDNEPAFAQSAYEVDTDEDADVGFAVLTVSANDGDEGATPHYILYHAWQVQQISKYDPWLISSIKHDVNVVHQRYINIKYGPVNPVKTMMHDGCTKYDMHMRSRGASASNMS